MSQIEAGIELDPPNDANDDKISFQFSGTKFSNIDYVLVYNKCKMEKDEKKNELRLKFENALSTQGIELEEVSDPNNSDMIYVRIFTPFERLAEEAEFMKLEMPLEKVRFFCYLFVNIPLFHSLCSV